MAKETFFFSHDYNSRNDPKLIKVMMKHGVTGIGVYWCIVEMIYEQAGFIMHSECERIAFELRVEERLVESILMDFDLFKYDRCNKRYWSESVQKRVETRILKSRKASESANKRWECLRNANALQPQSEGNAIKERKGKEKKGEERKEDNSMITATKVATIEDRRKDFFNSLIPFVQEFGKDTVRAFFDYWSESSPKGRKMRYEMEKVFDLYKRLTTWKNREKIPHGGRGEKKIGKMEATFYAGQEADQILRNLSE